jgi:hypothetical protein
MTAEHDVARATSLVAIQTAAIAGGAAILMVRPLLAARLGWTTPTVVALFAALLVVGLAVPVQPSKRAPVWLPVLVTGAAIFVLARLAAGGHPPGPLMVRMVGLNSLAAIAEEALFRRLAYGALLAGGTVWAVGGSALLFALVHVSVYGWWAFPLDLAAGLIFSWQRSASSTWTVPALTHVLADLLVVM